MKRWQHANSPFRRDLLTNFINKLIAVTHGWDHVSGMRSINRVYHSFHMMNPGRIWTFNVYKNLLKYVLRWTIHPTNPKHKKFQKIIILRRFSCSGFRTWPCQFSFSRVSLPSALPIARDIWPHKSQLVSNFYALCSSHNKLTKWEFASKPSTRPTHS